MKRTEHKENTVFSYVKYTPETVSGKLPLIVQLHGAGERGDDLSLVDVHGFSKLLAKKDFDAIFVMPQCPENQFWAGRVESIISFIEQIKAENDIDESRVYLTGLSMGGFGTWYTSMLRPDMFAAIAPVCGGGMAWNAEVLKMPVWAFHGEEDTAVSVTQSDEMVEALKNLGADVTYSRIPGVGHNVWDYTYDEELVNWFLERKINS